eukprot:1978004-Lingulodinium_polyedra.AAC.1
MQPCAPIAKTQNVKRHVAASICGLHFAPRRRREREIARSTTADKRTLAFGERHANTLTNINRQTLPKPAERRRERRTLSLIHI